MFPSDALYLDELYGWIKPFGKYVKFTGGVFENTDGLADYTDDIDDFEIGVFMPGEDGAPFTDPNSSIGNNATLSTGFLIDLIFGPLTLQLDLAPNYSKESASATFSELFNGSPLETDQRFFRVGGRVIFDAGVGTFSALFKTYQWGTDIETTLAGMFGEEPNLSLTGTKQNYNTFGAYFDFTAIDNLGLSLGYTGFLPVHDGDDVENVLYSGVDLRLTWTGIEGLSLSTHNNISFAKGSDKDGFLLRGEDTSYFALYNAVGATKEITETFSVNAEVMNLFSKYDLDVAGKNEYDNFAIAAKFIAKVGENAEFNAGLRLDITKTAISSDGEDDIDDTLTTFSIPVGIIISF
jgi:hypothetical protein